MKIEPIRDFLRELRSKTYDWIGRFAENTRNLTTPPEVLVNPTALRPLGLGVIALIRQHGIRITADQIDDYIAHGNLNSGKDLQSLFKQYGIKTQIIRTSFLEFAKRPYLFPCVVETSDGNAKIVISCKKKTDESFELYTIDPLDPTAKQKVEGSEEFQSDWSGIITIASKETGIESQDRVFDWTWFRPELYRFKYLLGLTLIISLLTHFLALAPIIFIQVSLDKVLGYGALSTLYVLTLGVLGALIFNGVLSFIRDYVIDFISTSIEARLAGDVFDKTMELPAQTFQTGNSSDFESVLQSPAAVKNFMSRQVLSTIFDATGVIVFLPIICAYSILLGLVVIAFTCMIGGIALFGRLRERAIQQKGATNEASKRRLMQSSVTGIETIKSFSLEPSQRRDWRNLASKTIRQSSSRQNTNILVTNLNSTLQQIMTIALVFSGVMLVLGGSLSAGAIISCNMLAGKVVAPVKSIFTFFADLDGFKNAINAISRTWNAPSERVGAGIQHVIKGRIVLRDVSVKLDDALALNNISLEFSARKKIGIVGSSGSGKTTFLRLCQGFLRPNTGAMEIDGQNFRHLDINNYRRQVAMIDQKPMFFGATIEENLRKIRPNISEREFDEIMEITGLAEVLKDFPDGISTEINQFGLPLSQGSRITLALARGLISQPRILMIDEAISSLDKKGQIAFLENLSRIAEGKTLLVVTHELRLIQGFDQIAVLDEGSIVGLGTHEELLKDCNAYQTLWNLDEKLSNVSHMSSEKIA